MTEPQHDPTDDETTFDPDEQTVEGHPEDQDESEG